MIVTDIIEQNADYREILLSQFDTARAKERRKSERGFCTDYIIDENAKTLGDGVEMQLGNSQWDINGVKNGTDYILWVKNGKIAHLEGFTYEEKWPDEITHAEKIKKPDARSVLF